MQLIEFDTEQETFDFVVSEMVKQGRRSTSIGRENLVGGRLRSEDGLGAKCAVGHLIRDEDCTPDFNCGVEQLVNEGGVHVKFYDLVQALQEAHDRAENFQEVLINFVGVAARFELNGAAVQGIT
jgi:hypothetical protein